VAELITLCLTKPGHSFQKTSIPSPVPKMLPALPSAASSAFKSLTGCQRLGGSYVDTHFCDMSSSHICRLYT
jgi:hypothetical protein